ncbi:MAG: hypothetical protein ACM3X0_02525 [Bacteroidota bacterium]
MQQRLVKTLIGLALCAVIGAAAGLEIGARPVPPAAGMPGAAPGNEHILRSALDSPGNPDYRFSVIPPADPAGWLLLLGALLTGGFIVHRRVGGD